MAMVDRVLRKAVREGLEQVAAARMIGDADAVRDAEAFLKTAKRALAFAVVKAMKDGVSKADVEAAEPPVVPEGNPRKR